MHDPRAHADVTPDDATAPQATERRWGGYVVRLELARLGWFYALRPELRADEPPGDWLRGAGPFRTDEAAHEAARLFIEQECRGPAEPTP